MSRTKGAKGKPKDPAQELDKVKRLYKQRGIPFPYQEIPETKPEVEPASQDPQPAPTENGQDVEVTIGIKQEVKPYQCGGCGYYMDQPLDKCERCGVSLTWNL
jgi:hypothetical protein